MVGLFAFMTVGTAVIIDLWYLLDIKRGLTVVSLFIHIDKLNIKTHDILIIIGTCRKTFLRSSFRFISDTCYRLPFLVLGTFRYFN